MPKKMSKGERINITDLAMNWAIIEPRKRYKTATDYAYYLEKDFRRCYEQGKKESLLLCDAEKKALSKSEIRLKKELKKLGISDNLLLLYEMEINARGIYQGEKNKELYAKQKQIELLEKVLKELDKDTFGFYEYQNDRDRQKLERWLEQELKKLKEVK